MVRVVLIILSILGVLALTICAAGVYMIGPRNLLGMWRYDQRQEGLLKVGDAAPDAAFVGLDGTTEVHLREHMGSRPLVLIFGSYT